MMVYWAFLILALVVGIAIGWFSHELVEAARRVLGAFDIRG